MKYKDKLLGPVIASFAGPNGHLTAGNALITGAIFDDQDNLVKLNLKGQGSEQIGGATFSFKGDLEKDIVNKILEDERIIGLTPAQFSELEIIDEENSTHE